MAEIQASRANTLDRILNDIELPDLSNGYFSYPVDDFFGDYVDALGQRGLQGSGALELSATPGQYDSIQFPLETKTSMPSKVPLPSAMSLDLPLIPDLPASQAMTSGFSQSTGPLPGQPTAAVMPIIGEGDTFDLQRPQSEQSGSAAYAPVDREGRKVKSRKQHGADYLVDSPGLLEDSDGEQKGGVARGAGKTKRNPKQQAQNKQAQQRYRERRKQRFTEMEHAIDGLSAQLEQMQGIQNQNAFLQAKRTELEARLSQREEEIERLKSHLQSSAPAEAPEPDRSPEQRRRAEDAKVKACQANVNEHIQQLSSFLKENSLEHVNPTGEGVDEHIVQRLAELVGQGCSTCHHAMRTEGVQVLRLMSSNVGDFSRIKCIRKRGKMSDILQRLRLTDLQKEQLKLMRQNHLHNLRAVYEARQQLNMQAMSLMLPPTSDSKLKDLDGKMACMSLSGYGKCARQTVDLDEILNSIKENLWLEQKQVMEMNYVTMHRLLSPIQGAFFLVDMHPAFCDALELANALVSQEKSELGEALEDSDQAQQDRHSPCSSDNKSDTCPLMERHDSRDLHGRSSRS